MFICDYKNEKYAFYGVSFKLYNLFKKKDNIKNEISSPEVRLDVPDHNFG
jgi:hypothetical protein